MGYRLVGVPLCVCMQSCAHKSVTIPKDLCLTRRLGCPFIVQMVSRTSGSLVGFWCGHNNVEYGPLSLKVGSRARLISPRRDNHEVVAPTMCSHVLRLDLLGLPFNDVQAVQVYVTTSWSQYMSYLPFFLLRTCVMV
jgi:hypothetical protein